MYLLLNLRGGGPFRRSCSWALLVGTLLCCAGRAQAGAYLSIEEALALAFPDAERVERRTFVLTEDQAQRIETLAKAELDSKLVALHVGMRAGAAVGYAWIDVHTVRTLSEGLMVVLAPDGRVRSVRVLAFHEPPEFLPNDRFRAQYEGKALDGELALGRSIEAVAGATLSSMATTRAVRRGLALYQVLITPPPQPNATEAGPVQPAAGGSR